MATVKLLERTYTLPEIASERFRRLQEQVYTRQRLIQEGVKPQPRRLGLIPRAPVILSEEERFRELDLLVHDYDAMIAGLREGKEAYEAFFTQLAAGVQQAVLRKSSEIRQIEQERSSSHQSALAQQGGEQEQMDTEEEKLLLAVVRLLGQATLLLLKKFALCREGINKLAGDQDLQRQILSQLVGQLENRRRRYDRWKRIERVGCEVAKMADVALNFEQYIREHFGPLQGLLEQVIKADASLHKAVAEIEEITQQMMRQDTVPWLGSDSLDQRMLDFLTASTLKRERLGEVLEHIERQGEIEGALDVELAMHSSTAISVFEALDNIQILIDVQLTPFVPLEKLWVNRMGIEFVLIPAGIFIWVRRKIPQSIKSRLVGRFI